MYWVMLGSPCCAELVVGTSDAHFSAGTERWKSDRPTGRRCQGYVKESSPAQVITSHPKNHPRFLGRWVNPIERPIISRALDGQVKPRMIRCVEVGSEVLPERIFAAAEVIKEPIVDGRDL